MPTKAKPVTKTQSKPKAAKQQVGGKLQARIGVFASRTPVATIEHHGLAQAAHAWGKRWLLTITAERQSRFDAGRWSFVLVDSDGSETDRLTFENAVISKTMIAGDELVALHGEPPAMRVEVFRQSAAGKLERTASRPGDASTEHLWANEEYAIAIGERLLLVRHREDKTLLVYERAPGFELNQLGETKIVFGEKMEFVKNEGFSGVAIDGDRAIVSGPGHKTGYQLLDLSAPAQPRVIATAKINGPTLQENVHCLGADRFLAFGWGGKALVLDFDATKTKLAAQKGIELGLRYSRIHREDDEVLIYDGNISKPFGIGVKIGAPSEKLGKIPLPSSDVQSISRIDNRVLIVCEDQSLLFD